MNPTLLAQGAAVALSGALSILRWLRDAGASHVKLRSLLQDAFDENRDISTAEVEALLGEAQDAIDEANEAIEDAENERLPEPVPVGSPSEVEPPPEDVQ